MENSKYDCYVSIEMVKMPRRRCWIG